MGRLLRIFKNHLLMIYNLLTEARLLGEACASFEQRCVAGITPNHTMIEKNLAHSLMLVTALNPHIGYENAAKIAKKARQEGTTLQQAAVALGLVTAQQFDEWVNPQKMVFKNS